MPGTGFPINDAERYHALLTQVLAQLNAVPGFKDFPSLQAAVVTLIFMQKNLEQHFPPQPKGGA